MILTHVLHLPGIASTTTTTILFCFPFFLSFFLFFLGLLLSHIVFAKLKKKYKLLH